MDPGRHAGDATTITVTYYEIVGTQAELAVFGTFTLTRPGRDG